MNKYKEFEIFENQKNKYILPGAVLIRWYRGYKDKIEVTSSIHKVMWPDGSMHEKFDCVLNGNVDNYYVNDLFRGDKVMVVIKKKRRVIEDGDYIIVSEEI